MIKERIQANAGEPFSKARKKKMRCTHYVIGKFLCYYYTYWSFLEPISEEECMCRACKKRFPIEKYAQMEELVRLLRDPQWLMYGTEYYLQEYHNQEYYDRLSKLSQGLEPVYYRRLSETETEILGTEDASQSWNDSVEIVDLSKPVQTWQYRGLFGEERDDPGSAVAAHN